MPRNREIGTLDGTIITPGIALQRVSRDSNEQWHAQFEGKGDDGGEPHHP